MTLSQSKLNTLHKNLFTKIYTCRTIKVIWLFDLLNSYGGIYMEQQSHCTNHLAMCTIIFSGSPIDGLPEYQNVLLDRLP